MKHFATYVQDDWQIAPRPDAQPRPALRRPVRLVQRGPRRSAGAHRRQARARRLRRTRFPSRSIDGADTRGDRNNFGPRIGLAWDASGDGRTNVHAGYGLFYDNMRTLQNFGELTWPQSRQIIISNPSFPDPLQGRSRDQFVSTAPPNITVHGQRRTSAPTPISSARRLADGRAQLRRDRRLHPRATASPTVTPSISTCRIRSTRVRPYPQFARVNYWQPTRRQQLHGAAAEVRAPLQRPLPVPRVLHAEQERRRQLPERLRRSLRLLQGNLSRDRPIAAIGSSSAASCGCRGICSSRRSATSDRACR